MHGAFAHWLILVTIDTSMPIKALITTNLVKWSWYTKVRIVDFTVDYMSTRQICALELNSNDNRIKLDVSSCVSFKMSAFRIGDLDC